MTIDGQLQLAVELIASIRAALKNGIKHYTNEGLLLENETEILTALLTYNSITLDETDVIRVTTAEKELLLISGQNDSTRRN